MLDLKVKKIVSVTSHVEATIGDHTISGDVRVRNGNIENIDSGSVTGDGNNQVASFNYYGTNNLNINYQTTDSDEMNSISSGVGEFIKAVNSDPDKVTVVTE